MRPPMKRHLPLLPILVTFAGIGFLSTMDAFMKTASLAVGAYSATAIRSGMAFSTLAPVWLLGGARWPGKAALKIHITCGLVGSAMALSFFFALTKLPLAETIAISFIAPVVSLYLAAVVLGERIQPAAIWGALLGLAGTLVIIGGKLGGGSFDDDTLIGLAAIIFSALLYAWNLVLQRQQALVARPVEVAMFFSGTCTLVYLFAAPWFLVIPEGEALRHIIFAAALTIAGSLSLAWAYARAEAQVLVPLEYTGFLWAVLFGWLLLGEAVTVSTIAGTVLIVIGCLIATRRRPEQSAI